MRLIPTGAQVWDPKKNRWLPKDGREIQTPLSAYWLRQIRSGAVKVVKSKKGKTK